MRSGSTLRFVLGVAATALATQSCGDSHETLPWRVRFASPDLAASAVAVEATVWAGDCDSAFDGEPLYRQEVRPDGASAMPPPRLEPGSYGFAARARDDDCLWYARGCTTITVEGDATPAEAAVEIEPAEDEEVAGCGLQHDWSIQLGGEARDVAVDGGGSTYLAGLFGRTETIGGGMLTSAGSADAFVARYDADGSPMWGVGFGGADFDRAASIAVDRAGNAYVTGSVSGAVDIGDATVGGAGAIDAFVASFGPEGAPRWAMGVGGAGEDHGVDVAVEPDGDVLVTAVIRGEVSVGGTTVGTAGAPSAVLLTVSSADGAVGAARSFDCACIFEFTDGGTPADLPFGPWIDVGADGGLAMASGFEGSVDLGGGPVSATSQHDAFAARYDPGGEHLWSDAWGAGGTDVPWGVALDAGGGLVVAGEASDAIDFGGGGVTISTSPDVFVASFDGSGEHRWSRAMGGVGVDYPTDVAAGPSDEVYVTGVVQGSVDFGGGEREGASDDEIFLASYDARGRHRASAVWGGPEEVPAGEPNVELGAAVAVDERGDVYVTGQFHDTVDFGGGELSADFPFPFDTFLLKLRWQQP